eukprot:1799659-Pleurochrysis_carterae.AAC.1
MTDHFALLWRAGAPDDIKGGDGDGDEVGGEPRAQVVARNLAGDVLPVHRAALRLRRVPAPRAADRQH